MSAAADAAMIPAPKTTLRVRARLRIDSSVLINIVGGICLFWILDCGFWICSIRNPKSKFQNLLKAFHTVYASTPPAMGGSLATNRPIRSAVNEAAYRSVWPSWRTRVSCLVSVGFRVRGSGFREEGEVAGTVLGALAFSEP